MLCLFFFVGAQAQHAVSGKGTDSAGTPLIGASVAVKNTRTGASTDANGQFTVQVPDNNSTLSVAYTGYLSQDVAVGASISLSIILKENQNVMDEVVVIGYGKQIRSTLTGNIAKLGNEHVKGMPVVSLEQAMQGQAAGVSVESVNGKLGSAARVRVRGVGSINTGWMGHKGARSLRLYVTGTNLLTFTKYDGWDPEVTADYIANNVTYGIDFYY